MYCLFRVHPETSLSQQRSTPIQISDVFSRGRDPIAHACRARRPAHVGSIFNECVSVIVVARMLLSGAVIGAMKIEVTFLGEIEMEQ